jgi:hypothetical protein
MDDDDSEWRKVSDELKQIIFHKYFIGENKDRWGNRYDGNDKDTQRLKKFISKRMFDEYGFITQKCCNYSGSFYSISDFGKDKNSRDGLQSRCKKHQNKRNRR